MFALVGGDVGDGRKDVGRVRCGSLDAVPMVDPPLACFSINIEVLQVVVEVNRAGAEVSAEQRSMGREDGGQVDLPLLAQGQSNTSQPLMEVSNDRTLLLVRDELYHIQQITRKVRTDANKPRRGTMQPNSRRQWPRSSHHHQAERGHQRCSRGRLSTH